jgi:SAM-dependent methyltransferase
MSLTDERTRLWQEASDNESGGAERYKGLPVYARPGLHGHVVEVVARHVPPPASILDLGAGSGALSQRLVDKGYAVSALDYVEGNFRLSIPFRKADLNLDFAQGEYDAIVACEIIEHLENPRHFLRQCRKMSPRLILSTPNPDSPFSKANYLRRGQFMWFSQEDYRYSGHISPLHPHALRNCAAECGYKIEDLHTFGTVWKYGGVKLRLLARLMDRLDKSPRELRGDILVAFLKEGGPPSSEP